MRLAQKQKDPKLNSNSYSHLTFDQDVKDIHWEKKISLFNKWCWLNLISSCRRIRQIYISYPVQESIQMHQRQNIKPEMLNLLEQKLYRGLCDRLSEFNSIQSGIETSICQMRFHKIVLKIYSIPKLYHFMCREIRVN